MRRLSKQERPESVDQGGVVVVPSRELVHYNREARARASSQNYEH